MKREVTLSEADVARVFNALADEHASKIEAADGRRTFQRIQQAYRGARGQLSARRMALLTLGPAAAAAAVTVLITSWLTPGPLSYEVIGATNDAGLIDTGSNTATVDFSDASRIVARPGTTLHMSVVGEHAALARVQDGMLNVKVEHADETDWRFLAGPYEVRVVGTKFDLDWQPDTEQLSIVMHEGRVRVMGPEKTETFLSAGQSKTFGQARKLAKAEPPPEPEGPALAGPAETASDAPGSQAFLEERPAVGKVVAKSVSWAKLVSKGRFDEVVQEAERLGIDTALNTRSVQDLQALAQAAQYTGRSALALRAWVQVRQRFGGKQAAFFMGRIYDQQGNAHSALRWLNVYLSEAGSDVYASEALGRKLTLVQRLQGEASAEAVAREYLRRFPKGTYARTARALVQ